jgi:hypothetical protein
VIHADDDDIDDDDDDVDDVDEDDESDDDDDEDEEGDEEEEETWQVSELRIALKITGSLTSRTNLPRLTRIRPAHQSWTRSAGFRVPMAPHSS